MRWNQLLYVTGQLTLLNIGNGTKINTVEEYDTFTQAIPESKRAIFEIYIITKLRYVELQRLYDKSTWHYKKRNKLILPKEAQQKVKQKQIKRTIDKLPSTFPHIFKQFLESHTPLEKLF